MSDEDGHDAGPTNQPTQVSFEAPASLVDRIEAIVQVLDENLESVLVVAVATNLDDAAASEDVRHRVAEQYYDDRLSINQVEQVVGSVEAQRLRLL